MSDEPVHFEGYALTYDGLDCRISRAELERAVADRSTVPLRVGVNGPVVGQAALSVDDTGLRVTAVMEPQGLSPRRDAYGLVCDDDGNILYEPVHTTGAPQALQRGDAELLTDLNRILAGTIGEVSIIPKPLREA